MECRREANCDLAPGRLNDGFFQLLLKLRLLIFERP